MKTKIFMVGFSQNKGGVESYISNLNDNLDKSKFDVIYNMPQMVIDGKTWIRPANRHNYLKYRRFWTSFYKENHFDVLYYNTCDVVSIDQLKFAKSAGVPIRIIHSHNTGNQQNIKQKMSFFHQLSERNSRKNLEKFATNLFACSKTAGDWMFDGRNYQIIKNGINLSKYKFNLNFRENIRNKFGYKEEKVVGIIGRLSPQKNPFFAIRILKALFDISNDTKAVFIGEGELRAEIEKEVCKLGLDDKIQFIGAVDNVNEWLSAIDCLLMPSLFEGLPFVLVEAQAAGLPCIVSSTVSTESNLTGLVEFLGLEEGTGIWADRIFHACEKSRVDITQQLVDAGYSIENTANIVSSIIEQSLRKV